MMGWRDDMDEALPDARARAMTDTPIERLKGLLEKRIAYQRENGGDYMTYGDPNPLDVELLAFLSTIERLPSAGEGERPTVASIEEELRNLVAKAPAAGGMTIAEWVTARMKDAAFRALPSEPLPDWRCVSCKQVVNQATEPKQCELCLGRTFAQIDRLPLPASQEEIEGRVDQLLSQVPWADKGGLVFTYEQAAYAVRAALSSKEEGRS